MEKIDFSKLDFNYHKTDYRFKANYSNGQWSEGYLSDNPNVIINEAACVLQYAQTVFEGMKAYKRKDGKIVCFRPDLNAERMMESCQRMIMPVFPKEKFLQAIDQVVLANKDYIPEYGSGASLYLRPFMIGTTPALGVRPATEFEFRIVASPVGPYFKGGIRPLHIKISDYDRAAPKGTGHIKAGLNYALSMYPYQIAHNEGYDENLYLDSATRTYIEETGGANIIFITKDGKQLITPKSDTILPSITRRSIIEIGQKYLGLQVIERPIKLEEIGEFGECGLCGTAAVISPIGKIFNGQCDIIYGDGQTMTPTIAKIREILVGIQLGDIPAPEGWIREIG